VSKVEKRASFTLFELILVIVIIGIVYTLFIQNIEKLQRADSFGLEDLTTYLKDFQNLNEVSLLCTDECETCTVYIGDQPTKHKLKLFSSEVVSYYVDKDGQFEQIKYAPLHIAREEVPVCWKFTLYENGSVSESILTYNEKAYYFPTYFGEMQVFDRLDSLEQFLQERIKLAREL